MPVIYTDYRGRLETLRKQYDLLPWIEVAQSSLAAQAAPGAIAPFNVQEAYALCWNEMPFVGWDSGTFTPGGDPIIGDLSTSAGLYNWWTGQGVSQVNQAQNLVLTDDLLGSYADEWVKLQAGARTDVDEPWQSTFQLGGFAGALNGSGTLYTGLRGYRLWDKGTVTPVQHTRRELLEMGKKLQAYTYSKVVTVVFQDGAPQLASQELVFSPPQNVKSDFLLHAIRIRPQSNPFNSTGAIEAGAIPLMPLVLVGLIPQGAPATGLQSAVFPWRMALGVELTNPTGGAAVAVPRLLTQWRLPIPLTIKANSRWNLNAIPAVSYPSGTGGRLPATMPMEFVLEGELIRDN